MSERIGVAISTTGDEHRLGFLETCVRAWSRALPENSVLFVTVDGSEEDTRRVKVAVEWVAEHHVAHVFRVGQPNEPDPAMIFDGRLGVAVNKNTGLELLMEAGVEHLFLSDDDTWPLYPHSLTKHMHYQHSMVCWGLSRLDYVQSGYAAWKWPRGVMLYTHRDVVYEVGGMDERFGPGGHEHVEWSQRIHNAGKTEEPFMSPASYAEAGPSGKAMRASALWHCEDMRRPDEGLASHQQRRTALTSVRRHERDWDKIHKVMAEHEGDAGYVPFRAHQNARSSATLCENLTCAVEPAEPRSEK